MLEMSGVLVGLNAATRRVYYVRKGVPRKKSQLQAQATVTSDLFLS